MRSDAHFGLVILHLTSLLLSCLVFFFKDAATTEIYTLSLQRRSSDLRGRWISTSSRRAAATHHRPVRRAGRGDRKSTRLNSSHTVISYAVFCLKKKKYWNSSRNFATSTFTSLYVDLFVAAEHEEFIET